MQQLLHGHHGGCWTVTGLISAGRGYHVLAHRNSPDLTAPMRGGTMMVCTRCQPLGEIVVLIEYGLLGGLIGNLGASLSSAIQVIARAATDNPVATGLLIFALALVLIRRW